MITAILLAAGESRRMRRFKQLLSFQGKTFVETCVDNLIISDVDDLVVVTGYRADDVRRVLSGKLIRIAHNPDYSLGMTSSLKSGLSCVDDNSDILVALADQPQIEPQDINRLLSAFKNRSALIVTPGFEGRPGHPIILSRRLRSEILDVDPAGGLREVVRKDPSRVLMVEMSSDSVLKDFDFPEDYEPIDDSPSNQKKKAGC